MTITERTTTWGAAILFSRRIEVVFLILILGISQLHASGQAAGSIVQGSGRMAESPKNGS